MTDEYFIWKEPDENRLNVLRNCWEFIKSLDPRYSWVITIKRYVKTRSVPQCRWLNGVAYKLIAERWAFDRDDVSEYLCGEFFGWVDMPKPPNRTEPRPFRTTTTNECGEYDVISRAEFDDYKEFVQRWAAEKLGLVIPDPVPKDWYGPE